MKHTTVHASQAGMLLLAELTHRWRLTGFVIYHIAVCVNDQQRELRGFIYQEKKKAFQQNAKLNKVQKKS